MLLATTKLQAVNEVLSAGGEDRVNSINTPEADEAEQFLDQQSRALQQVGWEFNTTYNVTLYPDTNGNIYVPANTLKLLDDNGRYTVRGNKLYDTLGNGLVFTSSVTVTIVEGLSWEDLPETARTFLYLSAGRKFQSRILGDPNAVTEQTREEAAAWLELKTADINNRKANVFANPSVQSMLIRDSSTRPFRHSYSYARPDPERGLYGSN